MLQFFHAAGVVTLRSSRWRVWAPDVCCPCRGTSSTMSQVTVFDLITAGAVHPQASAVSDLSSDKEELQSQVAALQSKLQQARLCPPRLATAAVLMAPCNVCGLSSEAIKSAFQTSCVPCPERGASGAGASQCRGRYGAAGERTGRQGFPGGAAAGQCPWHPRQAPSPSGSECSTQPCLTWYVRPRRRR